MPEMIFRALRAREGDALLILADGATVLIDGGTASVYDPVLREELLMLPRDGGDPPLIDLMMVSHIDGDHIGGILDLTEDLLNARSESADPIVRIDGAWHNSFSDMLARKDAVPEDVSEDTAASLASTFGGLIIPGADLHQSELVLSGVKQGRRLRQDLGTLHIPLNDGFADQVVLQGAADAPWQRGDLSIEVIGPTGTEMDDLAEKWKKELPKILAAESAVEVASASRELDKSVSNLASIVAIAKSRTKHILLTGDARDDMILAWLEATGHLAPGGTAHFDVLKIPHHGAMGNVSEAFFNRVTADHYVFSGNGRHGNPEPGAFEMLFLARPELEYQVHLTYELDEIKSRREFIKAGNVEELDRVLADPARMDVLRFPDADAECVEIAL